MADSLKPPYLKKVGQRGNITIWVVDGTYVRTHIDEEFTNYGEHYGFKCIPKNEFWLDKEAHEDEQQFFIDHLLVEYRLCENGTSYDDALEEADKAERAERKKAGDVEKSAKGDNRPDPTKVHVKLWKELESGVSVPIVDGRLVRSVFDIDFTEGRGMSPRVQEFVPQNEVWIDALRDIRKRALASRFSQRFAFDRDRPALAWDAAQGLVERFGPQLLPLRGRGYDTRRYSHPRDRSAGARLLALPQERRRDGGIPPRRRCPAMSRRIGARRMRRRPRRSSRG